MNPINGIGEVSLLAEPTVNLAPVSIISSSTTFSGISYLNDGQTASTNNTAKAGPGLHWVQLDLGAVHELNAIKLWHYFGDARSYRDVIVQLSNDPNFSSGVVTVFNNDTDGSAGLGVGTDSEYIETSLGKMISFDFVNARYARFYSNGSNVTGWNHYVEIEVYGVGTQVVPTVNLAPPSTISTSTTFSDIPYITDGLTSNSNKSAKAGPGLHWVQLDLSAIHELYAIKLWHYFSDGRIYRDVVVQLSDDPSFSDGVTTVFNNDTDGSAGLGVGTDSEYKESSSGKLLSFDAVDARYARFYSNGSNVTGWNHYVEIEIYGYELQLTEMKKETLTENTVSFSRIEQLDNTFPAGETQIIQAGVDGYDTVTYDVTYTDGEETGRVEVSRVTTAPVDEIVRVGTQQVEIVTERITVTENAVAYTTLEQEDASLAAGERVIQQAGIDGYDTVTYDVTYTNGEETGRVEVSRVTTAPIEEIVRVSLLAEPTINLAPSSIISSSTTFSGISYVNDSQSTSSTNAAKAGPGLQWVQLDLGAVHELNTIKLWHYFGDGRSYRDVIVQISNDPSFSSGVVTVFNNDTDGSAGLGAGTDSEYIETSLGKILSFNSVNARYARFYSNGSTATGWNHYVEIEVYGVGTQVVPTVNLAPPSTISTSTTFSDIPYITDGLTSNSNKSAKAGPGLHWVQLDLGAIHELYAIKLWHYFSDGRIYKDVVIQLSDDPSFSSGVTTVFNNDTDGSAGLGVGTDSEYKESSSGKLLSFNPVNARYARFYSNGSTVTGWNHYVEIEIYGHELQITEVRTETLTENTVSFSRIEQLDNTFPAGETQIIQAGVDGYDTVTYEVTYTDGAETGRVEVSRVTTAPVDEIVRVGTQQIEVVTERITVTENAVAYTTLEQEDASLAAGERVIQQAGVDGYDTVTYDVTYTNGEETGRVEVSRVTTAPVEEIVRVGPNLVVTEQTTLVENIVAYQTVEQEDASLPMGERVIQQAGVDGYDTVTYDVTYTNGEETDRVEVSRVTTAPIEEIVLVGTYSDDTYVIYAIADTHLSLDTSIASLEEATLSRSSIVAAEEQGVWMTAEGTFVTAPTVSERTQRMISFAAIANADQPDFVLHLGDGTAGPSDWNSFLAAWNSIYLPKLFVPGNHDFDNTTYASVASMFGYDTRTTIGNNKFSYAQEISLGDISFLLLDVDTNRVDSSGFQTKLDWAAGQLNSTTSPLALVVAHTAPHNYLRNNYDGPTAYAFNQIVLNALSSNPNLEKVQGIFGHEHPSNTYIDVFFGPDFPGLILKPNVYTVGSYTKITIDAQNNVTWEQRDLY
ncbi:G5 domain-containing protein [Trichococcus ilyis]|nr:G5 domain-containing protein [Trichococcus ilyis]